jgi:hypothetical protein
MATALRVGLTQRSVRLKGAGQPRFVRKLPAPFNRTMASDAVEDPHVHGEYRSDDECDPVAAITYFYSNDRRSPGQSRQNETSNSAQFGSAQQRQIEAEWSARFATAQPRQSETGSRRAPR